MERANFFSTKRQPKLTDICLYCWKAGHWKRDYYQAQTRRERNETIKEQTN